MVLGLVLVLALGAGAGAVAVVKQLRDADSGSSASSASGVKKSDQGGVEASQPSPSTDATPTASVPEPSATTVIRTAVCPDGTRISGADRCNVSSAAAALAAFGLQAKQCVASTAGDAHAGPVNFSCLDGQIHLAIYENEATRLKRLRQYGLGTEGCQTVPGQRIRCGPTPQNRWIRSYATGAGILIYASATASGYETLISLDQLSAEELTDGTPVS